MKFWSPVCLPPRAKNFGVWRSQWRVFRLLKQNIVSGTGGQAKKPQLELPAELSVVANCGRMATGHGKGATHVTLLEDSLQPDFVDGIGRY